MNTYIIMICSFASSEPMCSTCHTFSPVLSTVGVNFYELIGRFVLEKQSMFSIPVHMVHAVFCKWISVCLLTSVLCTCYFQLFHVLCCLFSFFSLCPSIVFRSINVLGWVSLISLSQPVNTHTNIFLCSLNTVQYQSVHQIKN